MRQRKHWQFMVGAWLIAIVYIVGALGSPLSLDLLAAKRWRHNDKRHEQQKQATQPSSTPVVVSPMVSASTQPGSTGGPSAGSNTATITRINPFAGAKFFVDPNNEPVTTAAAWRTSRPADAAMMDKIAQQPVTIWLGDWYGNIGTATKDWLGQMKSQGALPVFTLYNIPIRDCGSYSAGGASSAAAYKSWVQQIQTASAGTKAVFLLEPDALAGWECLSSAQQTERAGLLRDAAAILTASSNHYVYLDAGNANWHTPQDIASRLKAVGTSRINGVSLNISNFLTTASSKAYGDKISQLTGGLHVVVDSSRNGQGPAANDQWCNPAGRGLGEKPRPVVGDATLDAILWVKDPGESDGTCNGGPKAGEWWPEYALGLAQRAAF